MIKYIYKTKNKIEKQGEESDKIAIIYKDIEPQLLATVEVVKPLPYKVVDEGGIEKEIVPELNLNQFYPLWDKETMIVNDTKYKYPKLENGILREKTSQELIDEGTITLKNTQKIEGGAIMSKTEEELKKEGIKPLEDGEILEGGVIKVIPVPAGLIKPVWKSPNWEEGATKNELIKVRAEKIMNYEEHLQKKKVLEASKFTTEDEIKVCQGMLDDLEKEINDLESKIKGAK